MKSLKQIKADNRVYAVRNVSGQDFNDGVKYEISLKDGFAFDDGLNSSLGYAENLKSLNKLMDDIIEV